ARLARDIAELTLELEAVHLVDHAVDVEREALAPPTDLAVVFDQLARAAGHPAIGLLRKDRKAERLDAVEKLGLALERDPFELAEPVGGKPERPARRDLGVELAHRPGGGVARVHVRALVRGALALVQPLEVDPVHENFAPYFQ